MNRKNVSFWFWRALDFFCIHEKKDMYIKIVREKNNISISKHHKYSLKHIHRRKRRLNFKSWKKKWKKTNSTYIYRKRYLQHSNRHFDPVNLDYMKLLAVQNPILAIVFRLLWAHNFAKNAKTLIYWLRLIQYHFLDRQQS